MYGVEGRRRSGRRRVLGMVVGVALACGEDVIVEDTSLYTKEAFNPCPDDGVLERGYCVREGNVDAQCSARNGCGDSFVCRTFGDPACVCDPRPGPDLECGPRCTSSADCTTPRVCDPQAAVCRNPPFCMIDEECERGLCVDTFVSYWYVSGRGDISESVDLRTCLPPGNAMVGAPCSTSAGCELGACAGPKRGSGRQCGIPCVRNRDCPGGQACTQWSWGPPICSEQPGCEGEGDADELCRLGTWVTGCRFSSDCPEGDCQFPDSTSEARDFGGLGFGVGQCSTERWCGSEAFRSAWVDRWVAPTCFSRRACWEDDDCADDQQCLPVDALGMTLRCGRRI